MADVKEFRKKPVVIQAIQWDGTLSGMDEILSVFTDIRTVAKTSHPPTNTCSFWKIGTLEGSHEVSAHDFVIRGEKGEYYPRKPDILFMTYEPATTTPPADAALADDALCESLIEASDMRWNGDVYVGDGADLMNLVRAALRARAVPTHNLTEQDTADIARVLCWLKHGDTPPAAEIERIVHRNAELRGIVDDLRARAVPELYCVGRANYPARGGNVGRNWHVVGVADVPYRTCVPKNGELLFVLAASKAGDGGAG